MLKPSVIAWSMVLNPDGDIIAEAESLVEDLLIADLDAAALQEIRRDALQFFAHFRRPELYAPISKASQVTINR